MLEVDHYRFQADRARHMADRVSDALVKEKLLEMASEFGMEVCPPADRIGGLSARIAFDPYRTENFDAIVAAWLPFTFAMNSVARAMGTRDLYLFILSPEVIQKLSFIHGLVQDIAKRS